MGAYQSVSENVGRSRETENNISHYHISLPWIKSIHEQGDNIDVHNIDKGKKNSLCKLFDQG